MRAPKPFKMPKTPRVVVLPPREEAYKETVVREMRRVAAKRKLSRRAVSKILGKRPQQADRILSGHVSLDTMETLYRLLKLLDPATRVPSPKSVPPITPAELKALRRRIDLSVLRSLNDPRPPIPHEKVFADLRPRMRARFPMHYLKPEGTFTLGRYKAAYAKMPETGVFHGRVSNRRDTIQFKAKTIKQLEQAFHAAVAKYEAFCDAPAVSSIHDVVEKEIKTGLDPEFVAAAKASKKKFTPLFKLLAKT